jgi:hypothetical protein
MNAQPTTADLTTEIGLLGYEVEQCPATHDYRGTWRGFKSGPWRASLDEVLADIEASQKPKPITNER